MASAGNQVFNNDRNNSYASQFNLGVVKEEDNVVYGGRYDSGRLGKAGAESLRQFNNSQNDDTYGGQGDSTQQNANPDGSIRERRRLRQSLPENSYINNTGLGADDSLDLDFEQPDGSYSRPKRTLRRRGQNPNIL